MKRALKMLLLAKAATDGLLRTAYENDQFNAMYDNDPDGMTDACKQLVEEEKEDCPTCEAKSHCNMYAIVHGTYRTPAQEQLKAKEVLTLIDKVVDKFYDKVIGEGKDPITVSDEIKAELDIEQMIADLNVKVEE